MLFKMNKNKITPTALQKIFNEHRRTYRDRVRNCMKMSLVREKSVRKGGFNRNNIKFSRGDNLQAAVIRYSDGCESLYSES